ncbi:hypothetical protein FOMG_19940 [Fusarium oxysporum f. sp. melonis 26406]|uniref:Uncharacterized protein n=1 Tax=Fusarium oxysporum f. sp. melonis 26406 TaxID=1089452 RepID=W9ZQ64_FUSOX|nr:hypothetical protein FOMG_19940 [Fusarium oxysporum f. sp. melonis 26406]
MSDCLPRSCHSRTPDSCLSFRNCLITLAIMACADSLLFYF